MFAHLTPKERGAYFCLVLLFLFGAGWVGSRSLNSPKPLVVHEDSPPRHSEIGSVREDRAPPEKVLVHVVGAVQRPGVYTFEAGDRVQTAVAAAGGFKKDAAPDRINLAAKLLDGTQIVVPSTKDAANAPMEDPGAAAPSSGGRSKGKAPASPVDLNSASESDLETVPGIGPATATRILQYRQQHGGFKSLEELTEVGGIGAKKLERMRAWLRL